MKKILIIIVILLSLYAILRQIYHSKKNIYEDIEYQSDKGSKQHNSDVISSLIYYVSNDGDDNNTGLSPDQAWKTILKVNVTDLLPGITVNLKRGDEWRESLIINESGSSKGMITFAAYGIGAKPIINGADIITGWSDEGKNLWSAECPTVKDYYGLPYNYMAIVDGEMLKQVGKSGLLENSGEFFIDTSPRHDKIFIYSTTNPDTKKVEVSARKFGVLVTEKTHIKLLNLDFRNAGYSGAYFYSQTKTGQIAGHSLVDSCNFYRNRIVGIMFDNGYSNSIVQHCSSTYNGSGFYSWSDQDWGSDSITFSHCYSANNILYRAGNITDGHGYGIYNSSDNIVEYCESDGDAYGINIDPNSRKNNIIIRYNYVHNTLAKTPGINIGGNTPPGTIHQVYYNLVVNTGGGADGYAIWAVGAKRTGMVQIYNNTIYQNGKGSIFGIFCSASNDAQIRNNVIRIDAASGSYALILYSADLSGSTISNNVYYTPNDAGPVFYLAGEGYTTVAQWQKATGQESNSVKSDPLFISTGSDFKLLSNSPSVNAGVSVGLLHDILGNAIIGLPDIGCYEKQ
jgi:hypothetical protein